VVICTMCCANIWNGDPVRSTGVVTCSSRNSTIPSRLALLTNIGKDFVGPQVLNCREGTQYQPRLDDLRCTFAVHRITSWVRNGADLNRMLPALAAYMGQMGLGATERYLAMTPERFRKALNKLSPARSRNKWRNDPALMKFLVSL
jgi:hypothetical protein